MGETLSYFRMMELLLVAWVFNNIFESKILQRTSGIKFFIDGHCIIIQYHYLTWYLYVPSFRLWMSPYYMEQVLHVFGSGMSLLPLCRHAGANLLDHNRNPSECSSTINMCTSALTNKNSLPSLEDEVC